MDRLDAESLTGEPHDAERAIIQDLKQRDEQA